MAPCPIALLLPAATSSFPDGVIGIFHGHNPSDRAMALRSTHPLTEMSTRDISWRVKAADAYGCQPYHLYVPIVLKSVSLKFLEISGPVQPYLGIALLLPPSLGTTGLKLAAKYVNYVIHFVVCLATGPKPLPKRALHIVQSRASSFK